MPLLGISTERSLKRDYQRNPYLIQNGGLCSLIIRYIFRPYDHLQAEIYARKLIMLISVYVFSLEDGHMTETCKR
jgi:hypothetical protein